MGFGHRVYKNYDPRAKLLRSICADVLDTMKVDDHPDLLLAQARHHRVTTAPA